MATLLDVVGIVAANGFAREVAVVGATCSAAARDDLFTISLTQCSGSPWFRLHFGESESARLAHACLVGDEARVRALCGQGRALIVGSVNVPLLFGLIGGHVAAARAVLEYGALTASSDQDGFSFNTGIAFAWARAANVTPPFPLSAEGSDLLQEILTGTDASPSFALAKCIELGATALIPEYLSAGLGAWLADLGIQGLLYGGQRSDEYLSFFLLNHSASGEGCAALQAARKACMRLVMAHSAFSLLDAIHVAGQMDDAAWVTELACNLSSKSTQPRVATRAATAAARVIEAGDAGRRFQIPTSLELLRGLFWSACASGSVELASFLLDCGVSVDTVSPFTGSWDSAVLIAGGRGYAGIVRVAHNKGLASNDFLWAACAAGEPLLVSLRLQCGDDPNGEHEVTGDMPLFLACAGRHSDVIHVLLDKGADPCFRAEMCDEPHYTLLYHIVRSLKEEARGPCYGASRRMMQLGAKLSHEHMQLAFEGEGDACLAQFLLDNNVLAQAAAANEKRVISATELARYSRIAAAAGSGSALAQLFDALTSRS